MNYSKKRAMAQQNAPSLKYISLENGTVIHLKEEIAQDLPARGGSTDPVPNDVILSDATLDDKVRKIKVPVREYLKMAIEGNGSHYESEENNDMVKFPNSFTIVSQKDRTYNGEVVYPVYSYNKAQEFLYGDSLSYDDLIASGVAKSNTYKPVQDYKISIK